MTLRMGYATLLAALQSFIWTLLAGIGAVGLVAGRRTWTARRIRLEVVSETGEVQQTRGLDLETSPPRRSEARVYSLPLPEPDAERNEGSPATKLLPTRLFLEPGKTSPADKDLPSPPAPSAPEAVSLQDAGTQAGAVAAWLSAAAVQTTPEIHSADAGNQTDAAPAPTVRDAGIDAALAPTVRDAEAQTADALAPASVDAGTQTLLFASSGTQTVTEYSIGVAGWRRLVGYERRLAYLLRVRQALTDFLVQHQGLWGTPTQ